jgi:hypothetical protein
MDQTTGEIKVKIKKGNGPGNTGEDKDKTTKNEMDQTTGELRIRQQRRTKIRQQERQ